MSRSLVLFLSTGLLLLHPWAGEIEVQDDVSIVNPVVGRAQIKGDNGTYYFLRMKIITKPGAAVRFKQRSCTLVDRSGEEYSGCWIYTAVWSKDVSVTRGPDILMNTLTVVLDSGEVAGDPHKWNSSKLDGPDALLEYTIPRNGFVDLYFLWSVPKDFKPGRVRLDKLIDLDLSER